jgi:hypothetical protein
MVIVMTAILWKTRRKESGLFIISMAIGMKANGNTTLKMAKGYTTTGMGVATRVCGKEMKRMARVRFTSSRAIDTNVLGGMGRTMAMALCIIVMVELRRNQFNSDFKIIVFFKIIHLILHQMRGYVAIRGRSWIRPKFLILYQFY